MRRTKIIHEMHCTIEIISTMFQDREKVYTTQNAHKAIVTK